MLRAHPVFLRARRLLPSSMLDREALFCIGPLAGGIASHVWMAATTSISFGRTGHRFLPISVAKLMPGLN
jgi:hypothetical protein